MRPRSGEQGGAEAPGEGRARERCVCCHSSYPGAANPRKPDPQKLTSRKPPRTLQSSPTLDLPQGLCVETPSGDSSTPLAGTRCHPVVMTATVTDHCCRDPAATRTPLLECLSPSPQLLADRPWPWCLGSWSGPARPLLVSGSSLGGGRLGWCQGAEPSAVTLETGVWGVRGA